MSTEIVRHVKKGNDVLLALKKYGPMTRKTLALIVPTIKNERNFRRTLNLLCARKLVSKRFENLNGGQATVYQLNQNQGIRNILAAYLDCKSEDLMQKDFRYREIYHEQIAAQIAFRLKALFPEANVYRDYQLHLDSRVQNILPQINNFDFARPDILLSFWNNPSHSVSVAFEFERTEKSKQRLVQKLKSYSKESRLDGVVYVGSSDQIVSNLREIFVDKVLEKSQRISHYGNNFLLCTTLSGEIKNSLSLCLNAEMKTLNLVKWINVLNDTIEFERRSNSFS